jgi:hypothetical protein
MTVPDRAFVEMHLRAVRPECDRPESPYDDAAVRIGRGLKYPRDKGYAKFLTALGYDRNWAGMLALATLLIVSSVIAPPSIEAETSDPTEVWH